MARLLRTLVAICVGAAAIGTLLGRAASQVPHHARNRLEAEQARLDLARRRSVELRADLDVLVVERQRINTRLLETAKLVEAGEAQLNLISARVDELKAQEKQLRGTLEQRHETIVVLLRAMQRMGKDPPPLAITKREDALSMVRSAMLLSKAFPELRAQTLVLAEQLNDLARVMTSITVEGDKLNEQTARMTDARTKLAELQAFKRLSIVERKPELKRVLIANAKLEVQVSWLSALAKPGLRIASQDSAFKAAQAATQTSAGTALLQMSTRLASGSGDLASLVRQAQDNSTSQDEVEEKLIEARAAPQREDSLIAGLLGNLKRIEDKAARTSARLAAEFPAYAELSRPVPLGLADVQAQLRNDEALIFFAVTDYVFVWAVTRESVSWHRLGIDAKALGERIAELRQGLECPIDGPAWQRCSPLQLHFDRDLAFELKEKLIGPIEDSIRSKRHLLIVASGPLSSLPFHVLVMEKPPNVREIDYATYRETSWLVRRYATTVLPAVSSLKALRAFAKVSRAPEPFIGFGDPALDGNESCGPAPMMPASCPSLPSQGTQLASTASGFAPRKLARGSLDRYFRGALASKEMLLSQCPLPEAAFELRCVAKSLGVQDSQVLLRQFATETAVKTASLERYRIIHFATHGLLAQQTRNITGSLAEPALILTPPDVPTEADDGLLTASEIALLKLNADWIVLSACNTAAGRDSESAEALSGLARAFFYAGARALLVSHWDVASDAAVLITTRAFAELKESPDIGRAEAVRRAMLAMLEDGSRPEAAHPSFWAPFVLVGEGADEL